MAEQDVYKLPSFPTEFTESDQTRLDDLAEQRKNLQDLYLQNYLPEMWQAKPAAERYLRTLASTIGIESALHGLRGIIPGEALQWGLTPEAARAYRLEIEGEYAELIRRQKVAEQSATILNDIRLLALMGQNITTAPELFRRFPELKDWKDEEIAHIVSFAQGLIGKTADEILRATAEMPEITPEMIQAAYAEQPTRMPPEYILSSVAFAQDVSAIKDALTAAFPPQPEPVSAEETDQLTSALLNAQEQFNVGLGLEPIAGESLADNVQRKHELLAAGHDISFVDIETGLTISGTITEDNLVWQDGELLGSLDRETGFLHPVGLDGTVFYSIFEEESWFKDNIRDRVVVWAKRWTHGLASFVTTKLPVLLTEAQQPGPAELRQMPPEQRKAFEDKMTEVYAHYTETSLRQQELLQQWFSERPDLRPRPEYEIPFWDNPSVIKESGYWASNIMNSIGYTLCVWGTMIVVTKATGGNLPAGLLAATAVIAAPAANDMTNQLLSLGVPMEEAVDWGSVYGLVEGGVETFSDYLLFGLLFKPFKGATAPLKVALQKHFRNRALRAVATGFSVQFLENTEEIITSVTGDAIMDLYTDVSFQEYLSHISDVVVRTSIATCPFMVWGGGSSFSSFKGSLSADIQKKVTEAEERYQKAGATEAEAHVLAVQDVASGSEENTNAIASAIESIRNEHNTFVSLSSEEQGALIKENPEIGRSELSIEQALIKLIDAEIEHTQNSLKIVMGVQEAQELIELPLRLEGFSEKVAKEASDLNARLGTLNSERNLTLGRIEGLQNILSEVPQPEVAAAIPAEQVEELTSNLATLKAELKTTQEDLKTFKTAYEAHMKKASDLIATKGSAFEIQTERETSESLKIELDMSTTHQESLIKKILDVTKALNEAETQAAGVPVVEGIPMPSETQAKYLSQAQIFFEARPEGIIPGTLQAGSLQDGEIFIVSNAKGEILATGVIQLRDGKPTLVSLVGNIEKGIAATRAVPKILSYLEEKNTAFPPETEMSPDAIKVFRNHQAQKNEAPASRGAAVSGAGFSQDIADRIASEQVAGALKSRFVPLSQPQTVDGVPTINSWEQERLAVSEALGSNKKIAAAIVSPIIREAGKVWDTMSKEARLEWAEKTGLRKAVREDIAGKEWNDIPPSHRESITLGDVPNDSVHAPRLNLLWDKRYIFQWLQEKTGKPFYTLFQRIQRVYGVAKQIHDEVLDKIDKNPEFRALLRDKAAVARVEQEISSRNPALKIEAPADLTDAERRLADTFEAILKNYEPKIRYLRIIREFEENNGNLDAIYKGIVGDMKLSPSEEALVRSQLQQCIDYLNLGDYDSLWAYVQDKAWGVIGSGYTPWMVLKPELLPKTIPLSSTRGAARLLHRERVEFPSGMRTFIQRFSTYVRQVETYFYLRPELQRLDKMLKEVSPKMDNKTNSAVEANMRSFTRELQGLPSSDAHIASVIRRVLRQAMAAVFLHPYLSFRNLHQHLAFFPDRSELFRYLVNRPPEAFREKMEIYFKLWGSQMAGIRRDYMYAEEQALPGMGTLVRLAHRLSAYPLSDNIPRKWSCYAAMNKAYRAAVQYQKDGNINKWKKNSGVLHLTLTEQNYAMELLAQESDINFGGRGVRSLTGAEASSLFIGHEIANMTHFVYDRAFRAEIEQGEVGRIIFNLMVFPRSYVQRMVKQGEKLTSKETSNTEKAMAFKDITLMLLVGAMVSEWLAKITNRPRRSYNPLDIIRWDLGGLAIGAVGDLIGLVWTVVAATSPFSDPEFKKMSAAQIPGLISRNAQVFVPFYRTLLDSLEAIRGEKNIDAHMLRVLWSYIDKDYTPKELETMELTTREIFTKAILGGEPSDPDRFTQGQLDVVNRQAELGQVDADGRFYTVRSFVTDIEDGIEGIPDDMLTPEYGWSELVLFYFDFKDEWTEFQKITSVGDARDNYRTSNPGFNVWLCFWGFYSSSLSKPGTGEWNEFLNHIQTLFDYYKIDARMHPEWADWTLGIVPREA